MASRDERKLRGKVALITGASRGIGRAVASVYCREGACVFVCGRNEHDVEQVAREIRQSGGEIDGCAGDVGSPEDVQRIVRATTERFGAIDVLVNNASVLGPRAPIADYPLANEVLPIMLARRAGSIINVTSGVGRKGKARWGAYAPSKAGVECLTQVLADEVKDAGIRVNAVNPAGTRTHMRAQAYPAEDPQTLPSPEEITPIFIYLASDSSARITGESLDAREWAKGDV